MSTKTTIPIFTLCDGATSREGLLNILGAGITEIQLNGEFPGAIGATLAALVTFSGSHPEPPKLSLSISTYDDKPIGVETFELGPGDETLPALEAGPVYTIPLIINVGDMELPSAGRYKFTLSDSEGTSSVLEFDAN